MNVRWGCLFGCLVLLAASSASAQFNVVEQFNEDQSIFPGVVFGVPDIGWFYTPNTSYTLVRINTKFGSTGDVDRNVTLNIYTDRPSAGGQLLASETFNTTIARQIFGGANLNTPVNLVSGTRYFVGILNVQNLAINLTRLDNNCELQPGVDHLGHWATSGNANDGQFATLTSPGDIIPGFGPCQYPSFAQPLLQFLEEAEQTPTPTPTPSPTDTPTPTPTPEPTPCPGDSAVPRITGSDLPYTETVQTAANEPDIPNVANGEPEAPDALWYFTPDVPGLYQFSVSGFNLALGLYGGTCCEPIPTLGLDESLGGEGIVRQLNAGQQILVIAKGVNRNDFGEATLFIDGPLTPPSNDACAGARVINPAALPFREEINIGAANDDFTITPSGVGPQGIDLAREVFYRFTPTITGRYEIRANSAVRLLDLQIGVYTGACGSLSFVELETSPPFYYGEHTVRTLNAGTAYTLIIEGRTASDAGQVVVELRGPGTPEANSTCAQATVISPNALPYEVIFDTTFNANNVDSSSAQGGAPEAWWSFTPAIDGRYAIGLRAADSPDPTNPDLSLIDEVLTIYASACSNFTELTTRNVISYGEMAIIELQAGLTYTIMAEGHGPVDFGRMRLLVDGPDTPAPNDQCAGAIDISPSSLPFEAYINTLGSTDDLTPSATGDFGGFGAPDVFYTFTPVETGIYTFEVDLPTGGLGAGIDLSLGLYLGECGALAELESVDEGDGLEFTPERLAVRLIAGFKHTILVDGFQGAGDSGPMALRVNGPIVRSANDSCRDAPQNNVGSWNRYR